MKTYSYTKSQELFKKAADIIPCGIYGHFSPAPLIPASDYPFYVAKAEGSKFHDVDGNEFIDYMCGYGPMVLGYSNPVIDTAARTQRKNVNCATGPAEVMVDLAQELVNTIPIADWAFFAKNGADVTAYSLMIARAYTGRDKIIRLKGGYHGTAPWAQSPNHHGITFNDANDIVIGEWNNYDDLEKYVHKHKNEVAGIISTPYHHPTFADNEYPADSYWKKVENLCKNEGIVLIVDDVRTGFRLDMGGSNEYFGFKPDLIAFCKAIGNGYPISALVGTNDLMNAASNVFHTGSFWFSAEPMAAALATIRELKHTNAVKKMFDTGTKLNKGLTEIAKDHGYDLKITGHPAMSYYRITDDPSLMLHQKWCGECTKRGAYFTSHHNWFISAAHSDEDITKTLLIADEAFKAIKK
ncbi:aminotransferase class III-fold pyridoxal phosphate-dependent enzyme [Prolixibacteraceae bacterium Z1-6]|uniref:Aminotransferase class III-fold pyridoxal phosphate-dependent enzyme n=1 Tax=Draconibacterium aestuarii TaxID=2998507 RepID=A0A9X3FEL6_9BACT|nr:aminotransferase class III-fold pyridoxal phosphate-dependent enzyme [Prolixibacteraceae bacterium Z1-6]